MSRRIALLSYLLLATSIGAVHGQEPTADVLRPGEVRVEILGSYTGFRSLFADGGRIPLSSGIGGGLTPERFPPLAELADAVDSFLAATEIDPLVADPAWFDLGEMSLDLSWNTRMVPGRLSVGVLPRVELGVAVAAYRTELFPRGGTIVGGVLGLNPDPAGNAALLARLDATGETLGRSTVLPLEGSALGSELQDRVFSATSDSLALPDSPLRVDQFATDFGFEPVTHRISSWRIGDTEIDAKFELFRTFTGDRHYPTRSPALDVRITASGAVRIGTGDMGLDNPRLDWSPTVGYGGWRAGVATDLFHRRFWITGVGTYRDWSASTARVAVSNEPFPGAHTEIIEVSRTPGREIGLHLGGRVRLTDELSTGLFVRSEHVGTGEDRLNGIITAIPDGSRQFIGFALRYTNLPAYDEDRTSLPIEAAIGFDAAVAGSGNLPVARTAFIQISLLQRLWR